MKTRITIILLLSTLLTLTGCQTSGGKPDWAAAVEIDRDVDFALQKLFDSSAEARHLAAGARGILVFPSIVKGGFIVGAHYGEGALRVNGRTVGYHSNVAASYGLQAGIQSFGYALFFTSDSTLAYLDSSKGWEIGFGPSIVVVNAGTAGSLTTTTGKDNVYAFFFDQKV